MLFKVESVAPRAPVPRRTHVAETSVVLRLADSVVRVGDVTRGLLAAEAMDVYPTMGACAVQIVVHTATLGLSAVPWINVVRLG